MQGHVGSLVCPWLCVNPQPRPLVACAVWGSPAGPVRLAHVLVRAGDTTGHPGVHSRQEEAGGEGALRSRHLG